MRLLTNGTAGFPFAGEKRSARREELTFGFNPRSASAGRAGGRAGGRAAE